MVNFDHFRPLLYPNRHKARLFLFVQLAHARRASLLKGYWSACVPASAALESKNGNPGQNRQMELIVAMSGVRITLPLEVGEREG